MAVDYLLNIVAMLGEVARRQGTGTLSLGGRASGSLQFSGGILVGFHPPGEGPTDPRDSGLPAARTGGLRRQVGQAILRAAGEGTPPRFILPADGKPVPGGEASGLNAIDLALDASRAISDERALRQAVSGGSRTTLGPSRSALLPQAACGEKERRLLSLADGTRALARIIADSQLSEIEALRLLFALKAVGMLSAFPLRAACAERGGTDATSELDRFLARTAGTAHVSSLGPAADGAVGDRDTAAPREYSPQEQEERDALLNMKREIAGRDHYAVLGVDRRASEQEIRKTYYNLARTYHPDRLRKSHLQDIHEELEKMFAVITQAYNILAESSSREEYDRDQVERAAGRGKNLREPSVAARDSYLRGRKMLDSKKIFEAIRLFESAVNMDPSKSEYFYYLGVSQAQNPRWKKRAEESLTKAIEMNPGEAQGYLALARLYHRGGLEHKANEMYGEVLRWDPTNEEALAAVRVQQESAGGAGLLRSLFKKS